MTNIDLSINNIILFQILAYCILRIFFKPYKGNKIFCGIFAFAGPSDLSKELSYLVLSNIKMLGLYNDERGGDNAGIAINNNILHTTAFKYKFKSLIENHELDVLDSSQCSIIIGHSRKASIGGKGHENAHPFAIYNSKKDKNWYMAGIHNGTITNYKDLIKDYCLDPEDFKNDSKTVLQILSRQRKMKKKKQYSVLEKYEGGGVFMWYFRDEPDTIYIFKGAHKRYNYSADEEEERPLFFYRCPITNGFYFSSLKDPLAVIGGKDNVKSFKTNTVIKIKNGIVLDEESIVMDRSAFVEFNNSTNYSPTNYYGHNIRDYLDTEYENRNSCSVNLPKSIDKEKEREDKVSEILKHSEALLSKQQVENLNCSVKRILIPGDIPVNNSDTEVNKIYRINGLYYGNGKLLTGEFVINRKNKTFHVNTKVQYVKTLLEDAINWEAKYFFQGYMIKNKLSLVGLTNIVENNPNWKTDKSQYYMAQFCNDPVPTFDGKLYYSGHKKANGIYSGGIYCDNKEYTYEDGKLTQTVVVTKEPIKEVKLITDPKEISKEVKQLNLNLPVVSSKDLPTDPERVIKPEPIYSTADIMKNINDNDALDKKNEEFLIIDSNESEILDLYKELMEKVKEQVSLIAPYNKIGELNTFDFLSGNLENWVFDSMHSSLVGKDASPYFEENSKKELEYKSIYEQTVEKFELF